MSGVLEGLEAVLSRVRAACERSGRDVASVQLIAVSKTVAVERIRALVDGGHRLLGENRVQEALDKIPLLGPDVSWHLIGHLQTNKVRHAVGKFALIQGVDSEKLAREIDRRAGAAGLRQPILVQVNLAGETTKFGSPGEGTLPLIEKIGDLAHVELRGLMTIPPPGDRAEESRRWFAALRELRDRCAEKLALDLPDLSMGMTDDFEVAVEEGATLIRVGRAIFGDRPAVGDRVPPAPNPV